MYSERESEKVERYRCMYSEREREKLERDGGRRYRKIKYLR